MAVLSDVEGKNAICIICDEVITRQMSQRLNHVPNADLQLPEVLLYMIQASGEANFEMLVHGVADGEYLVSLLDLQNLVLRSIRMSDAMLLSYISGIPLYIDDMLMRRQSMPYKPGSTGLKIPINTLSTTRLSQELERAIADEDYHLATHLHEELQRRNNRDTEK